jgi:hypothetical protein
LVVVLVVVLIEDTHQVLLVVMEAQVEVLVVTMITREHLTEVQVLQDKDLEEVTQQPLIILVEAEVQLHKEPTQRQEQMEGPVNYQQY